MAYKKGDTITASDINTFLADTRLVYGVGSGDYGYGQTTINQANVAATTSIISSAEWSNLRTMVAKCRDHQGFSTTTLVPLSELEIGKIVTAHETGSPSLNAYDVNGFITAIGLNRLEAASSSMTLTTSAYTLTRSSTWNTTISGVFDVSFGSENAARYFFNSGGQLRLRVVHPNGGGTKDADWRTILATKIGTMTLKANTFGISGSQTSVVSNVGFYALSSNSGSPTTLINGQNIGSGAYAVNDFTVTARVLNRAGANGGNGSGIRFSVTLNDQYATAPDGMLLAGTAIHLDVLRATTHLSGIVAPTVTTVTPL